MARKILLMILCAVGSTYAGEYGYYHLPHSELSGHEDYGGGHDFSGGELDHEAGISMAHEYINNQGNEFDVHGNFEEHSVSSPFLHVSEEILPHHHENLYSSHASDFHSDHGTASSYVNIKGHDDKGTNYAVDHGSSSIVHSNSVSSGGSGTHFGLNSYAGGHGTSYVNVKQHPVESESYTVHHSGGGRAENTHIHDSSHTYANSFGHDAVSTATYKDYTGKGTSFTVHQSHGHDGAASISSKDSSGKEYNHAVFRQPSLGHEEAFDHNHSSELDHSFH